MNLRPARWDDLPQILAIYNDVILHSTAVYALEPVPLSDREAWFAAREQAGFPVIVAAEGVAVLGFASFGDWRGGWAGFRHTVEHSVHIRADQRGRGLGRQLLTALFPLARAMGKHVMLGGIDAENAASIRLHQSLGFVEVARFPQVGHKFDRWLDLVFLQKMLDQP